MKQLRLIIAALFLISPFAAIANPISVGDDVVLSYDFPSIGSPQCGASFNVGVAADASDATDVLNCFQAGSWVIDMNSSGFTSLLTLNFDGVGAFGDGFDGIVVSEIDWNGGIPNILDINTNLIGWSDAFASITSNGMSFNFSGLPDVSAPGEYFFDVTLHQVPEPGTLALLGLGLVGMAARRRKKI